MIHERGLYSEEGSLRPTAPFDFAKSLDFLGGFAPMQEDQTVNELALTKAVRVGGRTIVFQLRPSGTIKMPGLRYSLFADHSFSRGLIDLVADRISFFLSLEDDLDQFYRVAINDTNFAPLLQKLYGLHQVKFLTPFECACWAVMSQRNQLSAARKVKQELLERFGTSLEVKGHVYRTFPEPGQLAAASKEELKTMINHERREEYLGNVIKAFNDVDERFLRTAAYDKVEGWLKNIKGIGEWSARLILLRGLGRMEKLAVEKRLIDAAARVYGKPMTEQRLHVIAEKYGKWKGYWAYYLRTATRP
ncbi:MAG TPA: DNA-3-methyladenine glycosylase 2 family protein [Candidatus Bathyarchaeia archaeon]|nr:DNA-3-methyladenine glycosylase 2 family protein [Candidatus Bathyarchaeia archaeon]